MMAVFRAMNTDVSVLAPGVDDVTEAQLTQGVQQLFAAAERTFSRFRTDSELSRLNQADGPVVVSATMFQALQRARAYWEMTAGWFDPMICPALVAAGYDQSFAPGLLDRGEQLCVLPRRRSFADVLLDSDSRTVILATRTSLDFGGFIKGWAVDAAAAGLPELGAVDAGGDAVVRGSGVDGRGWLVDVEDPFAPGGVLLTLRLHDQAVATSGPNRRRWRVGNRVAHHLIDPHTRKPARTDLAQVTVVAPFAELADVLAKTAFLRGYAQGRQFLSEFPDVSAVFVLADAQLRVLGALEVDDAA
jgi:FAD:protein FMN transferase